MVRTNNLVDAAGYQRVALRHILERNTHLVSEPSGWEEDENVGRPTEFHLSKVRVLRAKCDGNIPWLHPRSGMSHRGRLWLSTMEYIK